MKKLLAVILSVTMLCMIAAPAMASEAATTDTNTVAVGAIVIAADTVSEDAIYNFVSTIYENMEAITEQHAKGAELSLEFASSVTAVPYLPGAAKYFEEKVFPVAAVKEGAGTGAKAGLFASVTFATDASYNTITIPSDAILTSGNADYVFTVDENSVAHRVYVTRGQTSSGLTEITSGLSGGETLVTSGQTYLSEGAAVRIVSGAADDSASAVTVEDASL